MSIRTNLANAVRLQKLVENVRKSLCEVLQYNRDADDLRPWAWCATALWIFATSLKIAHLFNLKGHHLMENVLHPLPCKITECPTKFSAPAASVP